MRGKLDWADNCECDWSFLSHEVSYFKGLGITKEDLVDEGVPVISYGQIHSKTNDGMHLRRDLLRYIPRTLTEGNENCRLRRGDIVFADTSEDVDGAGNCILVDTDDEIYAGYHTLVARPKNPSCGVYLARLFQSVAWRSQIQSRICGIKVFSITRKILKGVSVLTPSEESQRQIVAYLDEKTAAIDARVAVLEKKFAAYKRLKASVINRAVTHGLDPKTKLKDSGVDWIGKIPAGWEARNLTQCCDFFKGLAITKADLTESGTPVISYGQIHSKLNIGTHLRPELLRHVPEAIAAADPGSRLKVGDIVFADTSEDVEGCGNCVLIDAEFPVYAGYHAIVARPDESGRSRYLSYLFNAPRWRAQIRAKVAGIKVFSITQRIFKGVSLLLPSVADANAIADYLDAECAKIDKAAGLVTREIELYRKLKRSLINEVVTGKRKVA